MKEMAQIKRGRFKPRPLNIFLIALAVVVTGVLSWSSLMLARTEIKIQADGKQLTHKTLKATVGDALTEAGVTVGSRDKVTPGLKEKVHGGMAVVVERAFPVYLAADGSKSTVYTTSASVRDVLKLASLDLSEKDRVDPALDSTVEPGCEIRVIRVAEETIKEQFPIPEGSERKSDSSMIKGEQRIVQEGAPGEGERLIRVVYEDGKEVSRSTVQEQVLRPAVNRIVAYGTTAAVSRGGNTLRFRRSLQVRATAYGPSVGSHTATGHSVAKGIVAVDPQVIPLGSRLYVDGYGYGRALDVGSAIKGNAIDVFFPSDAECLSWGVRSVTVYILE